MTWLHSAFRVSSLSLLLALGACQRAPTPAACGGAADCLASEQGVVLGRDSSARQSARRELKSAAATYSAWFKGEAALPGLILLDSAAAERAGSVRGTTWKLTYDLAASRARESIPAPSPDPAPGGAGRDDMPIAVSRGGGDFDVARPGILAHEICHRHAGRAFERASGEDRALPDMLDEVAAISCESAEMKRARLALFAELNAAGKRVPWEGFLDTPHPLKTDPAMIAALNRLGKSGQGAVTFDIKPGSSYEGKVALFYSQAAAFGEFVTVRSCRRMEAIGRLLATYEPRRGLDRWLRANGAGLCLPVSLAEFERSFAIFVKRGAAPGGAAAAPPSLPR